MVFLSVAYYLLWAINFYLILRKKEYKIITILSWALFFVLFASTSATSGDAYKYKIDYEYGAFGSNWVEIGNEIIKWVCKAIGLSSYNQYLIVLFLLASILLFFGIRKLNGNYHIIFTASMGFIIPAMTVAIRFFFAFSVFVFCISYLIKGERIKYIIGIIIATSFHRSALFFLVFLLTETVEKYKQNDKIIRRIGYLVGIVSVLCAGYTLIARKLPFLSLISSTILRFIPNSESKVEAYFGSFTRLGFLIMFVVYIVNLLFSRYMMLNAQSGQYEDDFIRLSSFVYTINLLSAILLPLTIVNLVFFRLYSAQTIMNCIVFGDYCRIRKIKNNGKYSISISKIGFLFFLAVLTWCIPAFFQINSISISNMIMDSLFVV